MVLRYLWIWLVLAFVAVGNGILRQATYGRLVSELTAHQISTVTGILFTGVVVWLFFRRWPLESSRQAWTVGFAWLLMTIAFEFGFGHYVAGHPWSRLLADYNLAAGRIWSLLLIWITVMPALIYRLSRS